MTPKERAAMQQALEALEAGGNWYVRQQKAITALREALEQPDDGSVCARCGGIVYDPVIEQPVSQEPIAVVVGQHGGRFVIQPINPAMVLPTNMALYTAPQPVKELTENNR